MNSIGSWSAVDIALFVTQMIAISTCGVSEQVNE
jgi:hypothetical protein